jgi:hypothetical protein
MVDRVTPKVSIDWAGNGTFGDTYDDVTRDVAADPGLTTEQGMDASQALRPPMIDAADFEVFNHTGKYSQENAAGPLYQQIIPGKPVQIYGAWGARDVYDRHTPYDEPDAYDGLSPYVLMTGLITDITMTTELGNRRVKFAALGSLSKLSGQVISIPIQQNIRTDQALALILDAVNWPSTARVLAVGDTLLRYWWLDEVDAYEAALTLARSEGPCQLYEDGNGAIHFENRNYRSTTARSTTSQASFFDQSQGAKDAYDSHTSYDERDPYDGRASGLWFTQLSYDPSWKNIVNVAKYTSRRRTLLALGKVWEYGQSLTLSPGASTTLIARPANPFLNAVAPVAGTDYTVSAGSATVTLSYTSGAVAFIVVAAGGSGCTITGASGSNGLQLRAQSLAIASESVVQSTVANSGSVAKFGTRALVVGGWPEIDDSLAESICNAHVTRRQVQRPLVTITLRDADNKHIEQMLRRTVSDRVTIVDASSGLHADCWIETRSLAIGPGCMLTASWIAEKTAELSGAIWDGPDVAANRWDSAVWAD